MITMQYISSNGNTHELYAPQLRTTEGSFHDYKWTPEGKKTRIGEKIKDFSKTPAEYDLVFQIRGSDQEIKNKLNQLTSDFEYDLTHYTPGKIVFADYSIDCYVIASHTGNSKISSCWAQREVSLYCPYPFWSKETRYVFRYSETKSTGNKKYPQKYAYRYINRSNDGEIHNNHYAESNFKLIFYGPAVNPTITINSVRYKTSITLESAERLEINTEDKTIIKVTATGERVNAFHTREKRRDFFKPILPGVNRVKWSGNQNFDIILKTERSEPEWM